ncbi:MAG: rod shape-determining protein MreD [Frankiales bacterium]|nr:rod shape-determining protein MreD [Frankiales bacterium]
MTPARLLLGAATVLLALLLQTAVLSGLPLPGARPDLLVVVVVAFALAEGPLSGAVTGFVTGLGADLLADHALGRFALVLAVVGHVAGQAHDDTERSTLLPFAVVVAATAGAVLLFAGEGLLLGDPRVGLAPVLRSLASTLPYAVVLTPLVVPLVARLARSADDVDPVRLAVRR